MESQPQPPVTLDGWYALHQVFGIERGALRARSDAELQIVKNAAADALETLVKPADGGWSAVVRLVGSLDDVLFMHFRPTLEAIHAAQAEMSRLELLHFLKPSFFFLSVAEVGLYQPAGDDDVPNAERIRAEMANAHTRRRLYPTPPASMPYVSFYPTSKRRDPEQNWYTLPLSERGAMMRAHGVTGRRHAAHIRQIITGAIGLDAWEWGVTLFTDDPLELKRVVTDMRFDEVSAKYAEFGAFYVGRVIEPREWALSLGR
jgi:chlorite dismutase